MDIDLTAWAGLLLRWFHVMAGIMWIGTSFYFIWLQNALKPPKPGSEDEKQGVGGEVWAVHGGGFFHKKKYAVAPDHMPDDLHWFKWEAYLTWISGMLLLGLVYYYGASLYLIDRAKMPLAPFDATLIGLAFIGGGWIVYDLLCKSGIGRNNGLFGMIWFAALTAAAYALGQIFTGRGMFIHIGAMIGTVMAVNVFAVIIPNQKKTVASLLAHEKPDPGLGKKAAQRSLHNNYMTLPVLLIMISNHYPMLYGHTYNWLVLAGLSAAAWPIREFFAERERGIDNYRYAAAGIIGIIVVALFVSIKPPTTEATATFEDAQSIVQKHCNACHSKNPTHPSFSEAPVGVTFDTIDEIKTHKDRIIERAVKVGDMPLGNEKDMTEEERAQLGAGLKE